MTNATSKGILILAIALGLSACGEPGADRNEAGRGAGHKDPHAAAQHPESAMKMHDAMASAVGADVSDTWLRKMIEHHRGAIAMTDSIIAGGDNPRVVAIARRMAAQQRQEVEEMRRLVRQGAAPDPASAKPYLAAEKQMHDAMAAAEGPDAAETFLRQMIPHHQGAIDMSRIVLAQGRDERVAAIAQRIVADQGKEIAEMQAMLNGPSAPAPNSHN